MKQYNARHIKSIQQMIKMTITIIIAIISCVSAG